MPSLKVALVAARKSASGMPSSWLNSIIGGIVPSPTPTVPISADSISRMRLLPPPARKRAAAAAVIQPAVPPPTITTSRIDAALFMTRSFPICDSATISRCARVLAYFAALHSHRWRRCAGSAKRARHGQILQDMGGGFREEHDQDGDRRLGC